MNFDPEIMALNNVYESMRGLNRHQIKRIITWLNDKYGLELPELLPLPAEVAPEESLVPQESFTPAEPTGLPVKKRRGRGFLKDVQPQEPPEDLAFAGPSLVVKTALTGFLKFESLEEVFKVVNVRKGTEKIIIAAAFLQEGKNYKEISSYDISSALKGVDNQIIHVSGLINSLMTRTPPFLVEIGKYSYGKHGRRKFRVSEEGLKAARSYLR